MSAEAQWAVQAPREPQHGPAAVAGGPRRRSLLDSADHELIALLTEDGRRSNRALAMAVGLSEPTVAARLRSLSERRVLGVTVTLDWAVAGYGWDAWLQITVEGRSVREVAAELSRIAGVHQVLVVLGSFDLLVHVLLPTRDDAVDLIFGDVRTVAGVRTVRPSSTLRTQKFETRHARLPIKPTPVRLPAPAVPLDRVDLDIIDALMADGRQSNRAVARRIGVSEGTVRARLHEMGACRLLRVTARSDPYITGEVSAWAMVAVGTSDGSSAQVAEALAAMPESTIVTVVDGADDILLCVAAASRSRLAELVVDEIRALDGVRSTVTCEIVSTQQLGYQWGRLLG